MDCLKALSVTPHSSNELRFLDYNKIKIQNVSSLPITFNDDVIFKLLRIHVPIRHFRQMQSMKHKYDGHAWCKVKISKSKIILVWDLEAPSAWGTCIALMIIANNFSIFVCTMK
jgi:hypothetical protein